MPHLTHHRCMVADQRVWPSLQKAAEAVAIAEPSSWIIKYLAQAGIFAPVPLICGPVMIHWNSCETRNSMIRCVLAILTLSKASSNASRLGAPGAALR